MIDDPQAQGTLAELAESTASALLAFAQAVRHADTDGDGADLASVGLGRRQQEIAALAGLDTEEGMSTSEVARAIDYGAANTHNARCTRSPRVGSRKGFATASTPAGDSRQGIAPLTRTS
jgi:hypothetical protein